MTRTPSHNLSIRGERAISALQELGTWGPGGQVQIHKLLRGLETSGINPSKQSRKASCKKLHESGHVGEEAARREELLGSTAGQLGVQDQKGQWVWSAPGRCEARPYLRFQGHDPLGQWRTGTRGACLGKAGGTGCPRTQSSGPQLLPTLAALWVTGPGLPALRSCSCGRARSRMCSWGSRSVHPRAAMAPRALCGAVRGQWSTPGRRPI